MLGALIIAWSLHHNSVSSVSLNMSLLSCNEWDSAENFLYKSESILPHFGPEDSLLRASVCDQFQTENEGSECGMDRRALPWPMGNQDDRACTLLYCGQQPLRYYLRDLRWLTATRWQSDEEKIWSAYLI